ncbi:MAG TPA: hypothetical protein VF193_15655 [Steroidobacter sp.]
MNADDREQELERLISRVLSEQPLRQAPRSLELRVMAEIERRARLPWWRKSFAQWPQAARVAFLAVSAGFVYAGLRIAMWVTEPIDSAARTVELPAAVRWIQTFVTALITVSESVPMLWIYGGLAVLTVLYAVLFGVGTVAYRTIYAAPLRSG